MQPLLKKHTAWVGLVSALLRLAHMTGLEPSKLTVAAATHRRERAFTQNLPKLEVLRPLLSRQPRLRQGVCTCPWLSCCTLHVAPRPAATGGSNRWRAGISLGPHH